MFRQAFEAQQLLSEGGGLVGDAGQGQSSCTQVQQALHHARIGVCKLSVDAVIVKLIARPGLLIQGIGPLSQQGAQQMLRPLADRAFHPLTRDGVQSQIGKRARHRFGEVTQGVNQGAVQIEDDGVPPRVHHASAARMREITSA